MSKSTTEPSRHDVVIIGAGFSGMLLIHRLRDELGYDVKVLERGEDVGGTWFWNRYPGARCDFESEFYSYSDEEIQQEWDWSERYAAQPEILDYINFVADRWDVRRSIEFDTTVTSAAFDEERDVWIVETDRDATFEARYLIAATGNLSVPSEPSFPGMETFTGPIHHTGRWPKGGVDFSGQRVAVIGTGSSGIQSIPLIAEQAAELTVFQRTATFTVPAANRPLTERERQVTKQNYPVLREAATHTRAGILGEQPIGSFADVDPVLARGELERRWRTTGLGVAATLNDTLVSEVANEFVSQFVRDKINQIVKDPATAKLLEPHDYPIGTKRLALDTGYYETFNRSNVSLVSIRETPIERFSRHGIVVDGHEHEFDAIVLATGFDAVTGALERIDITGRGGQSLTDAWSEGARSYLGLAVHGFPNLFTVTGPGSPAVLTNVLASIEHHVEWISDYLEHLRREGVSRTEATAEAQADWVARVAELASHTLYPKAASWYMGVNVPGKPRVFLAYLGGFGHYRTACSEVAASGYPGFAHAHSVRESAARETERVNA
ncbi:NAD(P)/FAD-dependent oxidoreductase [Nocardioides carbamazepini]|uniref:flavin-containing monooxygenase n=1 Tax=Nocardioides carbamazepini TaxID=2854259 RepID=UPI002149E75A|nr:NAD(P)/FAD-dependent oxidoreductase [Nocardioides carbamazepini]MCR1781269.1 NAD(P)/FAD-dependent oxidoreductase [Nocardioides carbamazepini]